MAKSKGSGKHYTSKGTIGVNKKISNAVRADRTPAEIAIAKFDAFKKGKNVVFTIDNPNPKETNKRKIRVNARDLYGDPKVWTGQKKKETVLKNVQS